MTCPRAGPFWSPLLIGSRRCASAAYTPPAVFTLLPGAGEPLRRLARPQLQTAEAPPSRPYPGYRPGVFQPEQSAGRAY